MGVFDTESAKARTSAWRFTNVNSNFEYCPTYPSTLVVPAKISDATLNYGKAYRSKCRIPGLVYLHWGNLGSITRSSQPMVGLKNNRSIQDEKLIEAVFTSHSYHHARSDMANASYISHSYSVYGATPTNLIIDARPTTNAMANVAKGAGTENMEHYRNCKKVYLGIDNIHVMRDSLAKVTEAIRIPNETNYDLLRRSGWLKHLSCILEGIVIIVKAIHLANSHVLVHCSDGWDRTSQLSSISQLCLDPYYRTKEGFAVLIEKDWISYGHRFSDRAGHLVASRVHFTDTSGPDHDAGDEEVGFLASMQQRLNFSGGGGHGFRETCPVFDQFLDTVYQLQVQFPQQFEFNETFLLDLQKQLYECRFGNFLYNSEKERTEAGVANKTASVWSEMLGPANEAKYRNPAWANNDKEVLFPDAKKVQWWTGWFKREDMNAMETQLASLPAEPITVENKADDPVLKSIPTSTSINGLSAPTAPAGGEQDQVRSAPGGNGGMSLPINMDSPAISQASTAVQGAMRSAWSAWKSVRQGYDGVMKEMKEPVAASSSSGYDSDGLAAPAMSSRPATRPASPNPTRMAADMPTNHKQEQRPPTFDPSQSRYRENSELAENPWKSSDNGDADPLGVKVWS